ncbi:MAG: HAMP domain-containing histidine kinase [Deltaproteobacteria bacterium]|nr:MAG: HAMP domain-containing histidine kinase [Deltaproteobacteria bacterium]
MGAKGGEGQTPQAAQLPEHVALIAEGLTLMGHLGDLRGAVVALGAEDPSVAATHPDGALSDTRHDGETDLRGESIALVRARFEGHPPGSPESARWWIAPWQTGSGSGAILVQRGTPLAERAARWVERALASDAVGAMTALRAFGAGVVVADPDGVIRVATTSAAELFGTTAAALIGAPLSTLCGDTVTADLAAVEAAETLRVPLVGAGGVPLRARIERGTDDRIVVRLTTEEQHAERALRRDQLVAAIRHEIRTPLTVLRGVTSMLEEEPDMELEDRVTFLGSLKKETHRVITLVEDILTVARMDAARGLSRLQSVDLIVIASELATEARRFCDKHDISLRLEVASAPLTVRADRQLLEQLGKSLVGHVLRAAPQGLHLTLRATAESDAVARLEVEDDGPAPEIDDGEPFTSFRRSTATGKYAPGVGVGLAVAKRIADAHGWGLRVERTGDGNRLVLRAPRDLSEG